MERFKFFAILGVIVLSVILILSSFVIFEERSRPSPSFTNYIDQAQLTSINSIPSGVYVSEINSTIYVNSSSRLTVLMGPMNSPSMYSFEIFGLFNPDIVIKKGVLVNFTVVNVDTDSYHNFVISSEGPPYPYMTGMGMMGGNGAGFFTMMQFLPPTTSGHYAFLNFSYDFGSQGTLWYLCTYPGHAEKGMYGEMTSV